MLHIYAVDNNLPNTHMMHPRGGVRTSSQAKPAHLICSNVNSLSTASLTFSCTQATLWLQTAKHKVSAYEMCKRKAYCLSAGKMMSTRHLTCKPKIAGADWHHMTTPSTVFQQAYKAEKSSHLACHICKCLTLLWEPCPFGLPFHSEKMNLLHPCYTG